jgi:hypothetical protein
MGREMSRGIRIRFGDVTVEGQLYASPTATLIWEALPIEGEGHRWGEEIYFTIPVQAPLDDTAREVVERGDVGYWPPGQALCVFFGPTPVSQSDEIRAASAVNIVGTITGDLQVFKKAREGSIMRLESMER